MQLGIHRGGANDEIQRAAEKRPAAQLTWLRHFLLAVTSVVLTACNATSPALESSTRLAQLLASAERSSEDQARDVRDKPSQTMAFFGVQTGDVVLDLFAGEGYTSELLAHAVGPEGQVYAHNNAAYLRFAEDNLNERLERLGTTALPQGKVVRLDAEVGALPLQENSVDSVFLVMAYHDAYYKTDGWDVTADNLFATIHRVLKPGGTLAIIDHVAAAGTGSSAAQELHRIEPAFARADITSRGFAYSAESDVLRRLDDDLTVSVFDESIRGRSDRFTYLFVRENR